MVSISAGHHPLISHIFVVALKGTHLPVRIPAQEQKAIMQTRTEKVLLKLLETNYFKIFIYLSNNYILHQIL